MVKTSKNKFHMNNGPENQSILGIIRRIFRRGRPAEPPAVQRERRRTPQERENRETADIIIDKLKNIQEGQQGYDLFKGLRPDAATLTRHRPLANFLIDILHTPDPHKYHDVDWLRKHHDRLAGILSSLPNYNETGAWGPFEELQDRFASLILKYNKNRRLEEVERLEKMKEWMSPEAIEANERLVKARGGKTVDDYLPVSGEGKTINEAIGDLDGILTRGQIDLLNEVKNGHYKEDRDDLLTEAEEILESKNDELIKQLGKTQGAESPDDVNAPSMMAREHRAAGEKHRKLITAREKLGRSVVEKTGSTKARFYDAMRTQGRGSVEFMIQTDADYRDYWFYHILEPILYNQRSESSHQLYTLYVAGDMDAFLDIVRNTKDAEGNRVGLQYAARYDVLKSTIFQSHDMDYWAAHPSQDMKEFISSTALFLNMYIDAASQDPMVALGKRAYEMALLSIRDTHDGYIPREWLSWEEGKLRNSKLDQVARTYLDQMINLGQLYHIKEDDIVRNGLPQPSVWNRKQSDHSKPFTMKEVYGFESKLSNKYGDKLGDLKIAAALKQAKGLSLIDQRLLEIVAHSRGTGTSYEQTGEAGQSFSLSAKQFNSIPYEGIARHIAPMIHYYSRYRLGGEYYDAFFNMLVMGKWDNWHPDIMKEIVKFVTKGDSQGAIDYLESKGMHDGAEAFKNRLIEAENPFEYSGMWGPWTGWRLGDSTISFDDWERDRAYGTNIKLINAQNWAARQVRRKFESEAGNELYKRYRREYRDRAKNSNDLKARSAALADEAVQNRDPNDFDDSFEILWRDVGKNLHPEGVIKTYGQLLDDHWVANKETGSYKELAVKLKKVYLARTWLESAMRSPLLAARYIEVETSMYGGTEKVKLRDEIIAKILHIDRKQIDSMRTPTSGEEKEFDDIADLEATVGAISQQAIKDNKALQSEDFDRHIRLINEDGTLTDLQKEEKTRMMQNAKRYWEEVKTALLGDKSIEWYYQQLGVEGWNEDQIKRERGVRVHKIDWNQVDRIVTDVEKDEKGKVKDDAKGRLTFETSCITNKLLDRNYRTTLFSTEDMGWEYLNIGQLGDRNPVRRAGDLASHVQFAQLFEEYVNNLLVARPDMDELVKKQKEMWTALSGDFVDIAIRNCYRISYTTAMMYRKADLAWAIPFISPVYGVFTDSSIMQMIRGKDRADAWGPNDLLQYVQAVGGQQILPKRPYHGLAAYAKMEEEGFGPKMGVSFYGVTSNDLGKAIGGTKWLATWEIASTSLMIVTILNFYRALTAKSEEDEAAH
ncbi:hypothetical protein HY029_05680 [Candidatus Gottesmanbacteria bacterium]|nr:hypothetical protein [Candidatus Gottesmanbacteria bacterium]